MSRTMRSLFVGVVALVAMLSTTSTGSATTISPGGAFLASSPNTNLALTSLGSAGNLACTGSSISGTITTSTGTGTWLAGTIPVGGASYTGCTSGLLGRFTVTQNSAWNVRLASLLPANTGGSIIVTVPAGGVTLTNGSVIITVSGTATLLTTSLTVTANVTPVRVIASTLVVDSTNSPGLIPLNLPASYTGTYTFNRNYTISG